MTRVRSSDLETYFAEAASWSADQIQAAERSRRLAWLMAAGSAAVAGLAVSAVFALAPLKTVEPFVIRVDRTTGAVDVMTALTSDRPLTYDEAVSKHFLAQSVRAREGWLAPAAASDFAQVAIMSTPAEQQRWAALTEVANPKSPQNRYGAGAEAQIEIRAISFVSANVASVRFNRMERFGPTATSSDWIATVAFHYTDAPMAEADRLRNPLGFQVSSYRADPEVVP
ncbi:MAG: VirB8/TrbF family protein [Phenylobacterium sp.]|nr:VirB8/TrbF family protein [Phenylobacterium sp.]